MERLCRNHGTCCKEWGIPVLIIGFIFLFSMISPGKFGAVVALLATPIGMLIIGTCITTATGLIFRRKMQVAGWENDRPFNDGDDDTPDPYLFNPGPGASWGLRAFMPDVDRYSFAKTPMSWMVKQAKRKVAILLDDGTVSFPWFLTAWISDYAGGGTRINVPEGWKITANQASVLQKKRDEIKSILPRNRSEYQKDFLLFTELIFGIRAKIGREPVQITTNNIAVLNNRMSRLESVQKEHMQILLRDISGFFSECKDLMDLAGRINLLEEEKKLVDMENDLGEHNGDSLGLSVRDLARSVDGMKTTIQHHRRAILDTFGNAKAEKKSKRISN